MTALQRPLVDGQHRGDVVGPAAGEFHRRRFMQAGDRSGELGEQRRRQSAANRHAVEQTVLVEAHHLDHRIDQRTVAVEGEAAVARPRDAPDAKIEVGRGAPVERHLALAQGQAQFGRREIDIVELDRALELVGTRAGQNHHRDVGLDDIDRTRAQSMGQRIGEKCDGLGLEVDLHSVIPSDAGRNPPRRPSVRGKGMGM